MLKQFLLLISFSFFLFNVVIVNGRLIGSGFSAEDNPSTPKASLVRYWNKEICNESPRSEFLISKASPLNAVDSATFSKLAATNSLQTRFLDFCSAANLFCFPDSGASLEKHDSDKNTAGLPFLYQNTKNTAGVPFLYQNTKNTAGLPFLYQNTKNTVGVPFLYQNTKNTAGLPFLYQSKKNTAGVPFLYQNTKNTAGLPFLYQSKKNTVEIPFLYQNTKNTAGLPFLYQNAKNSAGVPFLYQNAKNSAGLPFLYQNTKNTAGVPFLYQNTKNTAGLPFLYQNAKNSAGVPFLYQNAKNSAGLPFLYQNTKNTAGVPFLYQNTKNTAGLPFLYQNAKNSAGIPFLYQNAKNSAGIFLYQNTKNTVGDGTFFRELSLKEGTVIPMPDIKDKMPKRSFLPQSITAKLPFSSSKLGEIKRIFHAGENSTMGSIITHAVTECERPRSAGETKRCVGSAEDMIDFVTSVLGRSVVLRTTENVAGSKQKVVIGKVNGINGGKVTKAVSCHQSLYPYLLYYCHSVPKVRVYEADLLELDSKKKINHGIAICHIDTSSWDPTHEAFLALGSKPGRIEVCHWIFENDMNWVMAD